MQGKKIYLGGQFENRLLLQFMKIFIEDKTPHKVNSRWIDSGWCSLMKAAKRDYEDVKNCDLLIGTWPAKIGSSSEIGYVMALNKPILFYIDEKFAPEVRNPTTHEIDFLPLGCFRFYEPNKKWDHKWWMVTNVEDLLSAISEVFEIK